VLRPVEKIDSDRVVQEVGSQVAALLHFYYEIWKDLGKRDELIPPFFRDIWGQYIEHVAGFSLPEEKRFRQIHEGHCTFLQPGEEKFVTPAGIRASSIVGTPEEIVDQLHEMERNGVGGISILVAADTQRKVYRDFAEMVMPLMR
jgi:alkanesulfonate monooxygenase SsuD/methylene tetrahydromethanopterin reductase-like flavin-dependent oxidoreductase (luciferase family)